jgi:hypothetical protein
MEQLRWLLKHSPEIMAHDALPGFGAPHAVVLLQPSHAAALGIAAGPCIENAAAVTIDARVACQKMFR